MIPDSFQLRMQQLLADDYELFMESFSRPSFHGLRINPLKTGARSIDEIFHEVLRPVDWCPTGFYYDAALKPGRHPLHEAGAYYIQEPSAMAPAEYLDIRSGDIVLDLCAAPGGKSTQIAGKLNGTGLLISNEIVPARAKILSENIERMGIKNAIVTNEAPARLAAFFPAYFDKIMVDAPCSGEGMFRKNETACEEWSPKQVELCAIRQREILDCAAKMLKPGGRMVYSTCTFSTEENEETIMAFLSAHTNFTLLEVPKTPGMADGLTDGTKPCIRLFPHLIEGEGHFVAVLQETTVQRSPMADIDTVSGNADIPMNSKNNKKLRNSQKNAHKTNESKHSKANGKHGVSAGLADRCLPAYHDFCSDFLTKPLSGTPLFFGDTLYLVPKNCPPLDQLKVLRAGLQAGSFLKNRFEPSHSLACALAEKDVQRILSLSSDDERVYRYLKGEAIAYDGEKGWYLLTADGYSLGFGKCSGGLIKNHYPKGLRKNLLG